MDKVAFACIPLLALAVTPALAASPLETCRAVADPGQRLACYDAIPLKGQAAHADDAAAFGLTETQKAERADKPVASAVTAKIAGLTALQVTLDNGMVWKVTDGSDILTWARIGQQATIKRGTLGGFRLIVENVNRLAVVARVK